MFHPPRSLDTLHHSDWFASCDQEAERLLTLHTATSQEHEDALFELDLALTHPGARMLAAWKMYQGAHSVLEHVDKEEVIKMLRAHRSGALRGVPFSRVGLPILIEMLIAMHLVDDRLLTAHFEQVLHLPTFSAQAPQVALWLELVRLVHGYVHGTTPPQGTSPMLMQLLHDSSIDWRARVKELMRGAEDLKTRHTLLDKFYADRLLANPQKFKAAHVFGREHIQIISRHGIQDIHPVTVLTDLSTRWLKNERDSIAHEPDNARVKDYIATMIWHVAATCFWNFDPVIDTRQPMGVLSAMCMARYPHAFNKKDAAINPFSYEQYFDRADTLDQAVCILTEAGQHHEAFALFQSKFRRDPTWTEFANHMIKTGYDPTYAALTIWSRGPARSRTDLLRPYVDSAPNALVLDVITPLFEHKPSAAQLKVLIAMVQGRSLSTEDQARLITIAQTLSTKARAQWLAMVTDVPHPEPPKRTKKPTKTKTKKAPSPAQCVRECLSHIRPFRLQKHINALTHTQPAWEDGEALHAEEFKRLITMLRAEDINMSHHPDIKQVVDKLDPKTMHAFSMELLAHWERLDAPAAHKWMLFQMRHLARKQDVVALGTRHDWRAMVSQSKWARASWYLELIVDVGPAPESDALFIRLLDTGTLDGTLQQLARHAFPRFATQLGCEDMRAYLTQRGLLNHIPQPRPLSFTPGETIFTAQGIDYTVLVDNAELAFLDESSKRSRSAPEGIDADLIAMWELELINQVIQWGAYYARQCTTHTPITRAEVQEIIAANDIVHREVLTHVLWQSDGGELMRFDEQGDCFDDAYEPVKVQDTTALYLTQLSTLTPEARRAWTTHFTDEEIVFPFDVLDHGYYASRVHDLCSGDFTGRLDVVSQLKDLNYHHGHVEDGGYVHVHYKTFAPYNVRAFIEHTGMSITNGEPVERPGMIRGIVYRDLFNDTLLPQDVDTAVYALMYDDLSTFLSPHNPRATK